MATTFSQVLHEKSRRHKIDFNRFQELTNIGYYKLSQIVYLLWAAKQFYTYSENPNYWPFIMTRYHKKVLTQNWEYKLRSKNQQVFYFQYEVFPKIASLCHWTFENTHTSYLVLFETNAQKVASQILSLSLLAPFYIVREKTVFTCHILYHIRSCHWSANTGAWLRILIFDIFHVKNLVNKNQTN